MKFYRILKFSARLKMEYPEIEGSSDTTFKRAFKFYKKRYEEPDYSNVLDIHVANPHLAISCHRLNIDRLTSADHEFIRQRDDLCPLKDWMVSTIDYRPGLYIISNILTEKFQLRWLQKALLEFAEPPNITNLSALGSYTGADVYRTCGSKLRWVTMGNDYNWSKKLYDDRPRQPLPDEIRRFASMVSNVLRLGKMNVDATILNYYPEKATLSPHVDISERDMSRPLISVSMGQSAIYLTGGLTLDDPVDAFTLNSGDVLVMHAAQRDVYHGVPRIVRSRHFDGAAHPDIDPVVIDFANNCRLNMTIRQVD